MNQEKLYQSVGYLLEKYNGRLNEVKLIRLLYLADREMIRQTGNTSIPISIDSIRRALGFTDSEIAEIHTEDELLERENAVLGIEMKGRTFWAALDPWKTERHLRFVISDPDENNLSLQPPETHPPQQ